MTFEEESEAQIEENRWRRANHIKWKCMSDGGHGGGKRAGGGEE